MVAGDEIADGLCRFVFFRGAVTRSDDRNLHVTHSGG